MASIDNTLFIEKLFGFVPPIDVRIYAINYRLSYGDIEIRYSPRQFPERPPAKWRNANVAFVDMRVSGCIAGPVKLLAPSPTYREMRADIIVEETGDRFLFRLVGDVNLEVICGSVMIDTVTGASIEPGFFP